MGRFVFLVVALSLATLFAKADDVSLVAHPATWTAQGKAGSAFILSTVHVLPANVAWTSHAIEVAAERADTYVFETPSGKSEDDEATHFAVARGRLPKGQTLQGLLSPVAQKDYETACTLAGLKPTSLDKARPWLAAVLLTVNYMNQRRIRAANTPDDVYYAAAMRSGKRLAYFDTTRAQLEFVARYDEVEGVSGFSTLLGRFATQPERINNLIATWSSGDTTKMAKLIGDSFQDDPEGARIFAQHNRDWATQLEHLLDTGGNYFVVVGIAHLVGTSGVPALLRTDGYRVEGP